MSVKAEWLEAVLARRQRNEAVERVLSVEETPVVGKGDNYASDITRLSMRVVLGSGATVNRALILKTVPSTEHRAKHIKQWGVFKRETRMYTEVLPILDDLLAEAGLLPEPLAGKCLHYHAYDLLLLEDLKESGFTMEQRSVGLDAAHAEVALRGLAKFHAATVAMVNKGLLEPEDYPYALLKTQDVQMMQVFLDQSFSTLASIIESSWGPEWQSYAKGLRGYAGNSVQTWMDVTKRQPGMFEVLNHGDFWLNNMMFRHPLHSRTPSSFRLIDFQMCFFGSPALDWHYFTNSSLKMEVLRDDLDRLLAAYHESLSQTLTALGIEQVPTLEQLAADIKAKAPFGLIISLFFMPMMKTDPEDAMDIEEILKKVELKEDIEAPVKPFYGKSFTETVKFLFKKYRALGLI